MTLCNFYLYIKTVPTETSEFQNILLVIQNIGENKLFIELLYIRYLDFTLIAGQRLIAEK